MSRHKVDESFLAEFEALLQTGPRKRAKAFLYTSYTAEPDPDVRRWMREVLLPRLAEALSDRPKKKSAAKTSRVPKATKRSRSVRTVSGGAPGLGKRR